MVHRCIYYLYKLIFIIYYKLVALLDISLSPQFMVPFLKSRAD